MTSFPNFTKRVGSGHAGRPARRGARSSYFNRLGKNGEDDKDYYYPMSEKKQLNG
jgi:hypothetical protein